jgi:biopolymer transport protein ExbB
MCESGLIASDIKLDANSSLKAFYNENLVLLVKDAQQDNFIQNFIALQPPLTYKQAGVFIYPLSICLFITVFVIAERSYSLRPGLTFPRKVEKALRSGEFPNKKWGRRSAAERISLIATQEKPSQEALLSYSRLEVAAMEKGLFLLEIVVAGAPLIGLLGTATGLVQVFSSMPTTGLTGGAEVFSEGIALALLTTIMGLAIAIPALIGHAYLIRVVDKRAASIDWLTARLIDATGANKKPTILV